MYVDIYHYLHTYSTYVVGTQYLLTYLFYLRTRTGSEKIAGTDPGTSTRPELPGSVPDFLAGTHL